MLRQERIVTQFLQAINSHDLETMATLMSADHQFVDSLGRVIAGKEAVREAWRGYFEFCRDYWVRSEHMFCDGDQVAVFGEAGGVVSASAWRTPAAWLARAGDGCVTTWRVFADNKPIYDILGMASGVP